MRWTSLLVTVLYCSPGATADDPAAALQRTLNRFALTIPRVETVDASQLQAALQSDAPPVLIDVRPNNERSVSTLPGAISLETFQANRSDYDNRPLVTYCTVGVRSAYVAKDLADDGLDVKNFEGSILAWTHIGGPLQTPSGQPTQNVHVYGKKWNFAAPGYVPYVGDPPAPL
ncbi:MAG: rhodanese-like domain-containing protein [Myxococcota bacterium]